jgi:uncharacterized membrane protein YfhO
VQVNADPGWRAFQDGHAIHIETDRLGFMVLHAAAAPSTHIELHYQGTTEQRVMAALSILVWASALFMLVRSRRS